MHPFQPCFAWPGGVHEFGGSCSNRSLLKKWHYLGLVCSVYVVTMTNGLGYSNMSCLKKWHFLVLVCSHKSELAKK